MTENSKEKYVYFAGIVKDLSRLDKLSRVPEIDLDDLHIILFSRNTFKILFAALPKDDLKQVKRDMIQRRLDWKNPSGIATFAFFKEFVDTKRDILEHHGDIDTPDTRSKSKAVFNVHESSGSTREFQPGVYNTEINTPKSWYSSGLIFPCPLPHHDHEMVNCMEFFSINPDKRWETIEKKKICFTCMRPKNVLIHVHCPGVVAVSGMYRVCQL